MTYLRQRMLEELQRRNYSPETVRCYIRQVAEFAQHFHRSPDQLGGEDIRQYQLFLIQERKLAWSTYNQIVSALRFFYGKTLNREFMLQDIPFSSGSPNTVIASAKLTPCWDRFEAALSASHWNSITQSYRRRSVAGLTACGRGPRHSTSSRPLGVTVMSSPSNMRRWCA